MNNNDKNRPLAGKWYPAALLLCACAIGLAGFLYSRGAAPADTPADPSAAGAAVPESTGRFDVEVIATQPATVPTGTQPPETTQPAQSQPLKTTSPVSGEEIFGYSMEALSYNETTRDWRTHNGVDIAAEAGTQVVAAADGEVYTTYEDEALGYTVVIRHEGGYTTRYSCLSEDLAVQAGDRVCMGDVIGTVGTTALVETALGPHLHFSVTYQNEPMDPADFLALG